MQNGILYVRYTEYFCSTMSCLFFVYICFVECLINNSCLSSMTCDICDIVVFVSEHIVYYLIHVAQLHVWYFMFYHYDLQM